MTLYMLFAALGILSYVGLAYIDAADTGFTDAFVAFGSNALAAVLLFHAYHLVRKHSTVADRASTWRRRIVPATLVLCAGGVAVLIAATRKPDEANIASPNRRLAAAVAGESTHALAAGTTLFQERGCVGCHRPDATGIGPTLHGLFGSPAQYPASGVAVVDDTYIRESILNPSATVAEGFPPVMPSFAGRLTEEELEALVVYVQSLSALRQMEPREAPGSDPALERFPPLERPRR